MQCALQSIKAKYVERGILLEAQGARNREDLLDDMLLCYEMCLRTGRIEEYIPLRLLRDVSLHLSPQRVSGNFVSTGTSSLYEVVFVKTGSAL